MVSLLKSRGCLSQPFLELFVRFLEGIDLLTEFQFEGLRLDEIEKLQVKNDLIDCNSSGFKHLDSHLKYFCQLCNRQLSFTSALTHLTSNEHMFRYAVDCPLLRSEFAWQLLF